MSTVNCYISVTTFATAPFPITPDSTKLLPPSNPNLSLLEKKPLKWTCAAAPLHHGGPLETSDLRKYWGGGGEEEDPLSSDEFIWNKDFVERFKRMIREPDPSSDSPEPSHVKVQSLQPRDKIRVTDVLLANLASCIL